MKALVWMFLGSALLVSGQRIAESTVSAAGGSAAGVAGKGVSTGIDRILGQVAVHAEAAGSAPKPAGVPNPDGLDVSRRSRVGSVPDPPGFSGPQPQAHSVRRPRPVPAPQFAASAEPAPALPAYRPPPRTDVLASIAVGSARRDLLAKGDPSSRMLMSDGGRLVEIYRYVAEDRSTASVRLVDGRVEEVRIGAR